MSHPVLILAPWHSRSPEGQSHPWGVTGRMGTGWTWIVPAPQKSNTHKKKKTIIHHHPPVLTTVYYYTQKEYPWISWLSLEMPWRNHVVLTGGIQPEGCPTFLIAFPTLKNPGPAGEDIAGPNDSHDKGCTSSGSNHFWWFLPFQYLPVLFREGCNVKWCYCKLWFLKIPISRNLPEKKKKKHPNSSNSSNSPKSKDPPVAGCICTSQWIWSRPDHPAQISDMISLCFFDEFPAFHVFSITFLLVDTLDFFPTIVETKHWAPSSCQIFPGFQVLPSRQAAKPFFPAFSDSLGRNDPQQHRSQYQKEGHGRGNQQIWP